MQFEWALHSFIKTKVASESMTDIIPGCCELTNKQLPNVENNYFFLACAAMAQTTLPENCPQFLVIKTLSS
jgi:hypothetical protein